MAKPNRLKAKPTNLPVPQTREAAADLIYELGTLDRQLQRLDAGLKDALAQVKRTFEEQAQPHKDRQTALIEGLRSYCEANRDALTNGGKVKTAEFTTGSISWRLRPPSVKIKGGEDAVITAIFASSNAVMQANFVRTKYEVSREGMLANPALALTLSGVSITSEGEDFEVKPFAPEGIEGRAA